MDDSPKDPRIAGLPAASKGRIMPINQRINRSCGALIALVFFATAVLAQDPELISGQNVNMVAGTTWPGGDPYLQRQNEPTIAVSTRNELHLMGGSNDYRTIDLPFLPPPDGEGKTVGDSWVSTYFSNDGGGRWTSTLLPGYPQDVSELGGSSPLKLAGYEASADPVIRAGTHGLFYYSGIAFTRGDAPPSAGFVATYMDLNNDERGNSIGYVRTTIFDQNDDGLSFIDKPWIAVDKPRTGAQIQTFDVHPADGGPVVVSQTVECGHVYVAYARIQGDGSAAISSQIMFTRSENCAASFLDDPIELSLPNTINQGAVVAIDPDPLSRRIQVAWRQFENATLNCTRKANFWRTTPEAWPVDQLELAGMILSKGTGNKIVIDELADTDDEIDSEPFDEFDFSDDADRPSGVLRQLLAAWLNILSGADSSTISDVLEEAEAWLLVNRLGTHPKSDEKRRGNDLRKILRDYNKGKFGPGNCAALMADGTNGLLSGLNPNAIMVVTSTDGGNTFSLPIAVTGPDYFPFEQGTTPFSFRTTGFPTMTFDGVGRSYIAYSTRGLAIPDSDTVGGDGRIVVTTSMNGATWTAPKPIDEPSVPGHQLMPAFEFSRGKVFLLYYDFREDVSGVFDRFITDLPVDLTTPRHSADVRAAQADAADVPIFTDYSVLESLPRIPSTPTSRYPFLVLANDTDLFSQQMLYNPPNLPMFKGGTVPFFGDYIDLAALRFIFIGDEATGQWEFDTDPLTGAPVVHAVWTDNRDVVGPLDGRWDSYVPPGDEVVQRSTFDPTLFRPVCDPSFDPLVIDRTKMRNQNIYTSRLTQGLAVALPGNNRPLGMIQRVFVGFIQNLTNEPKTFRLTILNQPPGGSASFDQFIPNQFIPIPVTERDEEIGPNSSVSRSIFVSSSVASSASVDISVKELDESGAVDPDGLTATLRINPDPSAPVPLDDNILVEETYSPVILSPAIFNLDLENPAIFNTALLGDDEIGIYSPAIFNSTLDAGDIAAALAQLALLNPAIFNPAIFNLSIFNPAIFNPAIFNLAIFNPAIFNPAIFNPAIFNPAIFNPAIFNLDPMNPAIFNPAIFNPAIFNSTVETTVVVENDGNATAAYSLNLDFENPPLGFLFQLMIYRTYLVPSVDGCELTESVVQEQLVNELTRDVNDSLLSPDSTSFYVTPDDNVVVTVRIVPDPDATPPGNSSAIDTLDELQLSLSIVPQAVDTAGLLADETVPRGVSILARLLDPLVIVTGTLPDGAVGVSYSATLSTSGGGGDPVAWSLAPVSALPPGLSLTIDGQIVGTPTTEDTFNFAVRANDGDQVAEQPLSITVTATPPLVPMISDNSSFGADTITLDPVTGLRWLDVTLSTPYSYDEILVQLGPGGVFEGFRLATSAEVLTFWQNAGINTGVGFLGSFTTENFQPIVDLMAFVSITGLNIGNLGGGNFFDFTVGHIESGPGGGGVFVTVATLSADPDPTVTGRAHFASVPSDNPSDHHGSWLVVDGTSLRADFDMSGLSPAGPYTCLRNIFGFNTDLDIGESINVQLFDTEGGSPVGSRVVNNNFGTPINNVAFEVFMIPPALTDGIGYLLYQFSQAVDVGSLQVQGELDCSDPTTWTPTVDATLTVM